MKISVRSSSPFRSLFSLLARARTLMLLLLTLGFVGACAVGDAGGPTTDEEGALASYNDDDGDGVPDAVDVDGDGISDYTIAPCTDCQVGTAAICRKPFIDEDGDRIPDGLDRNCDGVIDIRFGFGRPNTPVGGGAGTPPAGGNRCLANSSVNGTKFTIDCQNGTCRCSKNDQLTSTCAQTTNSCSLSIRNGVVSGTCCTF